MCMCWIISGLKHCTEYCTYYATCSYYMHSMYLQYITEVIDLNLCVPVQYIIWLIAHITINGSLLFCDASLTCLGCYEPSSGRSFTREYHIFKTDSVKDVRTWSSYTLLSIKMLLTGCKYLLITGTLHFLITLCQQQTNIHVTTVILHCKGINIYVLSVDIYSTGGLPLV